MADHRDLRDEGRMTNDEHTVRMDAATERAEWEFGDGSWAGRILGAYMNPEADARALAEEKA